MRRSATIALLAAALASTLLLTRCDDAPAPGSPPANLPPARERVEITRHYPPDSPKDDVRNSRASETRIVSGVNDAWLSSFPGQLRLELPPSGADAFAGALAIVGLPADKPVPRARLHFEIDFVGAKETRKHSVTLGLDEATSGWTPIQFVRGGTDATTLTIRGRFLRPDEVPSSLTSLRFALALPPNPVLGPPDEKLPNVLVISIDTLRADHLSCYGYERPTSPHLDALVAKGVLFERAYSTSPWTLPSYGSLFTALLPTEHRAGVVTSREAAFGEDVTPQKGQMEVLRGDVTTLAELLARRGYQTAGFVANPFLGPASGLARGFHSYTSYQYNARSGVDLALDWINSRTGARWFVFLHVIDPHIPYAPPKPFDTRFAKVGVDDLENWPPDLDTMRKNPPSDEVKRACVDLYDGEIAFVDAEIERLLAPLRDAGVLDDTLVVLHSDHGEEFWEHGSCDHGHTQHDELLRVPFAIVWPKKLAAIRVATRVRTLDLLPTVADLVGFDAPGGLTGKSLVPVLEGTESADRDVLSEAMMHAERETKALIAGPDKLIATGAVGNLLYDLRADPGEQADRSTGNAGLVETLRKRLLEHHAAMLPRAGQGTPFKPDAGTGPRLENLGYAGRDKPRPKPK